MNRKEKRVLVHIITNLVWRFWRGWPAMKGQAVVVGLALLALGWGLSRGEWRRSARWEVSPAGPMHVTPPISPGPSNDARLADDVPPDPPDPRLVETPMPSALGQGGFLPALSPVPTVTTPPLRREVITYTVQEGDNVWDIAQRLGISSDTIIWANEGLEVDPDLLTIGQELVIPPVSGVLHMVRTGDTLQSIANLYEVSIQAIAAYEPNPLQEPHTLVPGRRIMVPGGRKPFVPRLVYTEKGPITVNAQPEAGRFVAPASGYLTQYFSRQHPAMDLANAEGTPIRAAEAGQVSFAGWAGRMGNAVFIDHGKGYVTRYAHLKSYAVEEGHQVERGQVIGEMGNTGKSTGPHLHFAIHYLGGAVNPIRYLPPTGS